MLTLLLTLTLALPAGAVGQLNNGSLDTDTDYVSPDLDLSAGERIVEVILTNDALDNTMTVEDGGDFEAVVIEVRQNIQARTTGSIRVEIDTSGRQANNNVEVVLPEGVTFPTVQAILPITGALAIDYDESSDRVDGAVGTPTIINARTGLITLPISDDLKDGDQIVLSYETSPQETALLNVGGDSDNMDLLAVEEVGGPADYLATFEVASEVTISLNSAVPGNNIVHEQHAVPNGLRGNLEIENEEISNRYRDAALKDLIEDNPATDTENEADLAGDTVFYVQVANPPLRDRESDDLVNGGGLADSTSDVEERDSDFSVTQITDAVKGIIQLTVASDRSLEEDEPVEVDYRGSDSFYLEVSHGPIQNITAPVTDLSGIIVVPSGTDAEANASNYLAIISISDGADSLCDYCRVRVGVVTGDTRDDMDEDDPVDLPGRISVLGISYEGSQRISIPDGTEANDTFTGTLDFDPVNVAGSNMDDGNYIIDAQDIEILGHSLQGSGGRITVMSVEGNSVTFEVEALAGTTADDTVDVAYAIRAGADPRNALLPLAGYNTDGDPEERPIIAVSAGSRVTLTSGNDRATVDAEVDPPSFSSPSPAHRGATDDRRQDIFVDITDDLAGVNEDSVQFIVVVRNASYDVANDDLTFVEIGGGVRASIALDDVEDQDTERSPNIDADEDTEIQWRVTAADNAGNRSTSDAVADVDGEDDTQGDQDYTFNVDGQSAGLNRAYTGDWFDTVDELVKGDRRLGVNVYLPGASRNTSVRAIFNEELDCTTVSADDFTVAGTEPTAAECYSEGKTGDEEGDVEDEIAKSVFLTGPVMEADATPVVALVGAVSDKAGNVTTAGTRTAADGIAPSATLSVNTVLSKKNVTATVSTDERIRTLSPELHLWVSDALDPNVSALDEMDTFTVGREDATDHTSQLVLRDSDDNTVASGGSLEGGESISLTLSQGPVLDRNNSGEVTFNDVTVASTPAGRVGTDSGE